MSSSFGAYQIPATVAGPDAPVKPESTPAPVTRPEYVPEKFWKDGKVDVEGMAKAHGELEKQFTQNRQQAPKPESTPKPEEKKKDELSVEKKQEEKPKDGEPKKDETPKPEDIVIPGLKVEQTTKFFNEVAEKGALSEASYEELTKAGYPKHVVDQYLRGAQAEQAAQNASVSEIKALAGGEDGYGAMALWMSANLDEAELAEYNEAVNSGKKSVVQYAVKAMNEKYMAAEGGKSPQLLGGGNSPTPGDTFTSQKEVSIAMRDPRYKNDPAYRKSVQDKVGRSNY